MPITVLLADDNEVVRRGIRGLLNQYAEEIELVGEADSFAHTMDMAQQLRPQVIVMDVHMKDLEPAGIKHRLESYGSCIVAISVWTDEETKELAERFGAVRLLDKMKLSTDLIPAIRECTSLKDTAD
jgi:DNA-binding NarL/FixJ family response regulator